MRRSRDKVVEYTANQAIIRTAFHGLSHGCDFGPFTVTNLWFVIRI